jgi:hypothetical protein
MAVKHNYVCILYRYIQRITYVTAVLCEGSARLVVSVCVWRCAEYSGPLLVIDYIIYTHSCV